MAEEVEVEGIDIYLALDMSGSMRAIDMSEQKMQRDCIASASSARSIGLSMRSSTLDDFVQVAANIDRIGMVVFAKEAYLQFPLTLDYNTILSHVRAAATSGTSTRGGPRSATHSGERSRDSRIARRTPRS